GLRPNAKSVSERLWHMSHNMQPNAENVSHPLTSQPSALQEVARPSHGYHSCQPCEPAASPLVHPCLAVVAGHAPAPQDPVYGVVGIIPTDPHHTTCPA